MADSRRIAQVADLLVAHVAEVATLLGRLSTTLRAAEVLCDEHADLHPQLADIEIRLRGVHHLVSDAWNGGDHAELGLDAIAEDIGDVAAALRVRAATSGR